MTNLAHVTINLDRMDGTDNVRGGYVVFDPRVDVPHAPTHIHVQTVTVVLDDTGRGETDLVAGIAYAVSSNRLRSGHTIAPLAAGQTVDLSQVITTGTPLTPSEGAALAARIAVLEDAPPGSYDDTEVRALITSGDAATLTAAKAYADGITPPPPDLSGYATDADLAAHAHDASGITSGVLDPARLGTGTPSASTVLYGDGTWATPAGGGGSGGPLTGTGSPEGVVTATPGTEYLDTAGTCGAWRWIKVSGTGTTGWKVTYGDTGWRNIMGLLTNGATAGNFRIRRTAAAVEMRSILIATPTAGVFLTLPAGFQMAPGSRGNAIIRSAAVAADVWCGDGYALNAQQAVVNNGSINWTWTPTDPWPTTLPGTPA